MLSSMVAEPPVAGEDSWSGPEGETAKAVGFLASVTGDLDCLIHFESGSSAWDEIRTADETFPVVDGLCRLMDRYHLDELVLDPRFLRDWAAWEAERL